MMSKRIFGMRHTRLFAVAIVLVLMASSSALLPGAARATATSATVHPAASDTIRAVDQYGFAPGTFYVGLGSGNIYFTATDGLDSHATVQINDYNATRDNLTNPVATFTPTFGVFGYNESYTSNIFYQLPLGLHLGGWWNITINGASAGFSYENFSVVTYFVSVSSGAAAYLPDHTGSMFYSVNWTVNNAPVLGLTSIEVTGQYTTTTNVVTNLPGTPFALTPANQGTFNFTVPSNANTYSDLYFQVFANMTPATGAIYSESGTGAAPVGYVATPAVYLGSCPSVQSCQTSFFTSGETAFVAVQDWIYTPNGTAPAPGLDAKFQFDSGVLPVTPSGNYPASITTNASGGAEILFNASASVFSPSHTASLNVSLTDPLNAGALYGPVTVSFHVSLVTPQGPGLLVQFGSDQYYSGDVATANWWFGGLNSSSTEGWTVSAWTVWTYSPSTGASGFLGWGTIGSMTTSGSFSQSVPLGSGGDLIAEVTAYNQTQWVSGYAEAAITAPNLIISPSEYIFLPGDTVSVSVTTEGQALSGATLYETTTASGGLQLSSGVFSNDQFSFTVPALLTSSTITIQVSAQNSTVGVITDSQTSLERGTGLYVTAGIQTASNYADGSFQPGQTVTIAYQVYTEGHAVLPRNLWIEFYPGSVFFYGGNNVIYFETSSASGTFQYTIPSNTPAGVLEMDLYVSDSYCSGNCYPATSFGISVEPSPSVLGYELGAGSGITVAWVILLVIILLIAVVLLMAARRRSGRGGRGGVSPYSSSPSTPASSSSSTGPAGASADWKETPSSGGSSGSSSTPPLPQPPNSS